MSSISDNICEAISIIVNKAVNEAAYDKTIQATVLSCVDASIGKYKVQYQDSTFYAYSTSTDTTYTDNSVVYVLVPASDMSKDKTIVGTVKKLGVNYVSSIDDEDAYEVYGNNVIKTQDSGYGLCSYGSYDKNSGQWLEIDTTVLYDKNRVASYSNKITLDDTAVAEYIGNSGYIKLAATFKTALDNKQAYHGNFGIILSLDFTDNSTLEEVTRTYVLDVDNMVGNPYKQISATTQDAYFEIDNSNFLRVNNITIFSYDFPIIEEGHDDDIFISNIELCGAELLDNDSVSNLVITMLTPQGTYFTNDDDDPDTKSATAQVRVKGKVVDANSQDLPFYWGRQDVGITAKSVYYNKNLGQGWRCLNDYNVIEKNSDADPTVVEWIPADDIFYITRDDITAKEIKYKVAVVYDDTVITKTFTFKNLTSSWDITIESDKGTQFYYDIGRPTLTCKVNGIANTAYTYSWAVTNNAGNFESLAETTDLNESYQTAYENYWELYDDIYVDQTKYYEVYKYRLQNFKDELNSYDYIQRVCGNQIIKLDVSAITTFSTYQCSVYYGDLYLGTQSIVINNSLESEGVYSLIINNGSMVYKYDTRGVSPTSSAVDNPIDIKALTITAYDNNGEEIDADIIKHCTIEWYIPNSDTMLQAPSSYEGYKISSTLDGYDCYSGLDFNTFTYAIASRYDETKTNNTIYVKLYYKDMILSAETSFTFVKEGENGTNGTEYVCRLVPYTEDGTAPDWAVYTNLTGMNFTPIQANHYFKVELWHNDELIWSGFESGTTDEDNDITVNWEFVRNDYGSVEDSGNFTVDSESGKMSGWIVADNQSIGNLLRATIEYEGVTQYVTIPIVTVILNNIYEDNYRISLADNSGYKNVLYTTDGVSPDCDDNNPFEIIVEYYDNDSATWCDVTNVSTQKLSYVWSYEGYIYEDKTWLSDIYLKDGKVSDLSTSQRRVKPISKYNGWCITNAIVCNITIGDENETLATVRIPINLMLNRYGNSAINSWNGNSIEVNDDNTVLLAPQIGAGQKEDDNSFTGVVMGVVKEAGKSNEEVGLFGYSSGVRTIFLDAETGKSEFGANGKGQIVIDPSDNKAEIYSGNYTTSGDGAGLKIDLTTPYIQFGTGNFSVDANGFLTAKGGGSIAGWNISDTALYKGQVGISSDNSNSSNIAFWAGSSNSSNAKFTVSFDGTMTARQGYIGNGSSGWTIGSNYIKNGKNSYNDSNSGAYIGTDGIGLGPGNFYVTRAGYLYSSSGTIGGWTITNSQLKNADGSIYIGIGGMKFGNNFSVTSSGILTAVDGIFSGKVTTGELTATGGTIGGWTINTTNLSAGNIQLDSSGSIKHTGNNWSINSDGTATFSNIIVTGGTITLGGTTLNSSGTKLTSGKTTVGSKSLQTYVEDLIVGKLKATDVTITASLSVGNSTYYLRMGQGTKNPEVSGLNVGSQGIKVQGSYSGANYRKSIDGGIQVVSRIGTLDVDVHKGSIVGIETPVVTGVSVSLPYWTRELYFASGIFYDASSSSSHTA